MTREFLITRFRNGVAGAPEPDQIAVEQPLEIRVQGQLLAMAMRTPGQDKELTAGWLVSEGIVRGADEIADIVTNPGDDPRAARVDVMLHDPARFDADRHRRAVLSNASCGLCGAATVAQVLKDFPKIATSFLISAKVLTQLPARLSEKQPGFAKTGGLHACAIFDEAGELLAVREDAGRHNALDKLIGWALLEKRLPLSRCGIFLSGRVSYEMMQKALAAGAPLVAAIGAPSSLAVELARESGQTLVAFLRGENFNVYSGKNEVRGADAF